MAFLGLDAAARKTGISLVRDDGTVLVAQTIIAGSRRGAERLAFIRTQVNAVLDRGGEPVVDGAIEGGSFNSVHREFTLGEVSGVLRAELFSRGIDLHVVPPALLKKFATRKGQASKEQILNAVKLFWDVDGVDDNAADAVVLAQIARAFHHPPREFRHQAEVIAKLRGQPALRLAKTTRLINV